MLVRSSQEQWSRSTSPECSKSAPDFMMSIQELSGALRSTRSGWAGVHLPECSRFHDEHPGALRSPQEHQEQLSRSASPRVLPECSQADWVFVMNFILADCVLEKFTEERGARLKKVTFKLSGISFLDKGIPSWNGIWSITTSPSNHTLCMSLYFSFGFHYSK